MTLLELLQKLAAGLPNLVAVLTEAGDRAPDLKPTLDAWIAALESAVTPENFAALAGALPAELLDIARGKISPHDHPSDDI